ncbi:MAG: amidase family protein [Anaerolineae bacterium]|jgi:aspartyl-tRNA(Asn)/glutamyl-tRNA(Gln) amidotransferase subunit A
MAGDDLAYMAAVEALKLFRSRKLSPVELVSAVVERAAMVEPKINAFAEEMFEQALEQARRAESRYGGREPSPRLLEGIPVAVKEEQPIAGRSWEEGSLLSKGNVADVTHPVVERIVAAGGIIHARTTAPEFSCAGFTHSLLWGVTRNPWNLDCSPGGSSGGSGAALAAGTATLATGSDIGGSIRIPASFCGIVGYKPPYGRVPALPPFNLDHYCHDGPMARTVADCALLENVLVGPHPIDAVSLRPAVRIPEQLEGIEGFKIALSIHLGDYPVAAEVVNNTLAAADALRQAGAVIEDVELAWKRADVMRATWAHFGAIFAPVVRHEAGDRHDLLAPYTRAFLEQAETASRETDYVDGLVIEGDIYAELGSLLERFDALLCPTVGISALRAGEDYVGTVPVVDGEALDDYLETALTPPFNIASRCPVAAVPSGRASNGVPTGVQIVAPTYDDVRAFQVAAALERVRPWFGEPSWRPSLSAHPGD